MIREAQSALASIKDSAPVSASTSESLEQFLGKLPDLWRQGDVRATHEADAQKARKPHTWRTRRDPFEGYGVRYWTGFRASRTPRPRSCWIS